MAGVTEVEKIIIEQLGKRNKKKRREIEKPEGAVWSLVVKKGSVLRKVSLPLHSLCCYLSSEPPAMKMQPKLPQVRKTFFLPKVTVVSIWIMDW